jgi:hypothetical protein
VSISKSRQIVKRKDEAFRVDEFLVRFNRQYRTHFEVVDRPDPPDAIIQSTKTGLRRWVEVTSAFTNAAWARDVYSYATPGETHIPMSNSVMINGDQRFASSLCDTLISKIHNTAYERCAASYGKGFLVVAIQYPAFDETTLRCIKQALEAAKPVKYQPFRSVFLHYRAPTKSGYDMMRLSLPDHLCPR